MAAACDLKLCDRSGLYMGDRHVGSESVAFEVPRPEVVHTIYHSLGKTFTRQDVDARNQAKRQFVKTYQSWRCRQPQTSGRAAPQSPPRCRPAIELDMPKLPARANEVAGKKREGMVIDTPPNKSARSAVDSPMDDDDLLDDCSDTTSAPGVPRA